MIRAMRKPLHGDQLTIRYDGAIVRARCDDVSEPPNAGPGAANFTIVSQSRFERGREAFLLQGPTEQSIHIVRVTPVGHHRANKINVVLFSGIFDLPAKTEPRPTAPA